MMRRAELLALAAAAALAGCELPALRSDLAQAELEVPEQWSAGAGAGLADRGWLADLSDPVLDELVEEAIENSFDLEAAAARMAQARQIAVIAGAAELPILELGGSASRRGAPAGSGRRVTDNAFEAGLDAAWEADLWGRLANQTRAATLDAAVAEWDYRAARLSLAAAVAQGWYRALEAELQVALAEDTVRNFSDNLVIVEESFRSGLRAALDVRLERANLAGAQARLEAQRRELDLALRGLEALLGRYPAAELALSGDLPRLRSPVPAGLPAELLARRPDLRAAALRLEASDERFNLALKNRLPSILLTGSGGLTSTELSDLLDFDALLWRLAADIAAPLYRGGELGAERELARAEVEEALAAYAERVLQAFREVESALTAEGLLAREEAALRRAAEESEAAEALALERYRSGLVDIITWLEARRRAFDAKSAVLAIGNERLQNRIALYLALGGSFEAAGALP